MSRDIFSILRNDNSIAIAPTAPKSRVDVDARRYIHATPIRERVTEPYRRRVGLLSAWRRISTSPGRRQHCLAPLLDELSAQQGEKRLPVFGNLAHCRPQRLRVA